MGVIAVITNCALIALSPSIDKYTRDYSDVQVTLFFVAAEVNVCSVLLQSIINQSINQSVNQSIIHSVLRQEGHPACKNWVLVCCWWFDVEIPN